MKITIVSGTNRKGNLTRKFVDVYARLLTNKNVEAAVLDMQEVAQAFDFEMMYHYDESPMKTLAEQYVQPADGLVFVVPEYNGSFPGMLKLFIDSVHPDYFKGKIASVIGVASGRAGNLRGIDHLHGVLHHLNMTVVPHILPISQIYNLMNDQQEITDETTITLLEKDAGLLIDTIKKK